MSKKKSLLKDQGKVELKAQFDDLSKEIFKLRNELSSAQKLDKPHLLHKAKRDRARILTILNQKGKQA